MIVSLCSECLQPSSIRQPNIHTIPSLCVSLDSGFYGYETWYKMYSDADLLYLFDLHIYMVCILVGDTLYLDLKGAFVLYVLEEC